MLVLISHAHKALKWLFQVSGQPSLHNNSGTLVSSILTICHLQHEVSKMPVLACSNMRRRYGDQGQVWQRHRLLSITFLWLELSHMDAFNCERG